MPFLKSVNLKGSLALAIGCWCDYDHFSHGNGCFLQTEKKNHTSVKQGYHRLSLVFVNLLISNILQKWTAFWSENYH